MLRQGLFVGLALMGALAMSPVLAQPRQSAPGVLPYLPAETESWLSVLPPPPAKGSAVDGEDVAAVRQVHDQADPQRAAMARLDEEQVYSRFVEAFGSPIDRAHAPHLIRLLNRAEMDIYGPLHLAKGRFQRPRPYSRLGLRPICAPDGGRHVEPATTETDSYPSGHAARGWVLALLLGEVAPDRRVAVMARAVDYGFNREVCAMHFPSDVEAGRVLAVHVVDGLAASPEFSADLLCARSEHRRLANHDRAMPAACAGMMAGPATTLE